jgi:hypothetical protein
MNKKICLSSSPLRRAPRSTLLPLGALALSTVLLAGCGNGGKDQATASQATPAAHSPPAAQQQSPPMPTPAAARPADGNATVLAAVAFTPPAGWQDLGPSNMRAAQYRRAAVGGDNAGAEVNVFYFGPASGGGVDANLQRWINQMVMPDGGDPSAAAKHTTFTADGMAGHVVTLEGTYKSGGPMMGGTPTLLEGYRLVGVVLEGPEGSLFFKLTGPVASAKAMEAELMAVMQGARKAG